MDTSSTISVKHLHVLLKSLPKMVGAFSDVLFLPNSYFGVGSPSGVALVKLPSPLSTGDSILAVPLAALDAALSGRKNPQLSYESGLFTVTDVNYRVNLNSRQVSNFVRPQSLKTDAVSISRENWLFLGDKLSKLNLDKIHPSQPDPNATVRISDGKIFIGVQDKFQFAFYSGKLPDQNTTDEIFQLPYPTAVSLFKHNPEKGTKLHLGRGVSYQTTAIAGFQVETGLFWPEDESAPSTDVVISKAKSFASATGSNATIPRDSLLEIMANGRSISVDDTRLNLTFKGSKLLVKAESSTGDIKAALDLSSPADAPFSFSMEHKFLSSFLTRLSGDFTLTLYEGVVKVKSGPLTYVSATSV